MQWLTWAIGIIAGAFIGVIFTVLLQDKISDMLAQILSSARIVNQRSARSRPVPCSPAWPMAASTPFAARGLLQMDGVDAVIRSTDDPEVVVTEITHHGWSRAWTRPAGSPPSE